MSFEDVVTTVAEQGFVTGVDEHNKKEWIDERLTGFRTRAVVPEYQMSNGRWRQAQYDGLPDGSTIARYLDITDQKRQRDELRASEERYTLAVMGTNDGIWERNLLTEEVHRSQRWLQILGYEQGDLDPHQDAFEALIHPDDRDGHIQAFAAHLEEHIPFDHEYRLCHKSGEYIWVRATGQAVWDEDGKPLRMAGSIGDISERKRAEDALRESEERFSNVFNNSPSSIMLKDLDGRFRLVNEQFAARLGMSPDEVVGKTSHDLWPVEQADALVDQDQTVLEKNTKILQEHIISLADGNTLSIVMTKFPVTNRNGQAIGVGAIAIDVTEQRRAEALLIQAQKMEAVGQLTGGIAHEFNNLLMVVVGNIELLQDQLPKDGLSERLASTAMKGAMRGAELTQRLLTFSRKQTLAVVPVDLNDLVLSLHDMLRRTLGETFTLETEFAEAAYVRRSGHTGCCVQGCDGIECSCFVRDAGAAPWIAFPTA
jgi:PAS domain S-box-containing protein